MKITLVACAAIALAVAIPSSQATHVPPTPGCHDDGHGNVVCIDCLPPMRWLVGQCRLPAGPLPAEEIPTQRVCAVTIRYAIERPGRPYPFIEPHEACDRVGLELAIAQVLARLLGAP
jgi:hypothetical protein